MMDFLKKVAKSVTGWVHYRGFEEADSRPRNKIDKNAQEMVDIACDSDPVVARWLIKKFRLNVRGFFMIGLIAVAVTQGLSLLYYTFVDPPLSDFTQFLYQWQRGVAYWLVLPAMFAFYPWITRSTGYLFANLYKDGVVKDDSIGLDRRFEEVRSSVQGNLSQRRWSYMMALLVFVFHVFWIIGDVIESDIWVYFVISIPVQAIGFYMIFFGATRVVVTIIGLYRLFGRVGSGEKSTRIVQIRPWHPDRCGGLGALSRYALYLSYFIALFGFWLTLYASISVYEHGFMDSIRISSLLWSLITLYIVFAPTLFFLTLSSARPAMLETKSEYLNKVSRLIDDAYADAIDEIRTKSKSKLVSSAERVNTLNELYRMTRKFPVWPFDFNTISRFSSAVLAALIPLLIEWIRLLIFNI